MCPYVTNAETPLLKQLSSMGIVLCLRTKGSCDLDTDLKELKGPCEGDENRHSQEELAFLRSYRNFHDYPGEQGTPQIVGFWVRLLQDEAVELEGKTYYGLRPLVCVETEDRWPDEIACHLTAGSTSDGTKFSILFEPAVREKRMPSGELKIEADKTTSTVCTWKLLIGRTRRHTERK